jgi:hypothetical protein
MLMPGTDKVVIENSCEQRKGGRPESIGAARLGLSLGEVGLTLTPSQFT